MTSLSQRRAIPGDFRGVAGSMTRVALLRHYRTSNGVLARWLDETGIAPAPAAIPAKKPTPPDLAVKAVTMGRNQLALHYGLSYNTIVRMLADAGLKALATPRAAPKPRATGYRKLPVAKKRSYTAANHRTRDVSAEGEAADFLRRETRATIYRSTETGRADPRGGCWRYGNVVLAGGELVDRARRHGWNPDAWQTLGLAIAGHEADKSGREQHG